MRGQVAFEYIIIVGLVLMFLIPLWSYIASVQEGTSSQLSISYSQNAVNKIASNADLVFSQGPPAKITTTLYIPPGVQETIIIGSTIIFRVWVRGSLTDVTAVSNANITGSLPATEGNYQISIDAVGDSVTLSIL